MPFHALCAETGFEPDIIDATDDHLFVRSLITSGLGVAMISSHVRFG